MAFFKNFLNKIGVVHSQPVPDDRDGVEQFFNMLPEDMRPEALPNGSSQTPEEMSSANSTQYS